MTAASLQIWRNARLAPRADPAEVIGDAAIVVRDGRIEWFGHEAELDRRYDGAAAGTHR